MNEDVALFLFLYAAVAALVGIPVALRLDTKRKARLLEAKPYRWGYYVGCMGLSSAPLALAALTFFFGTLTEQGAVKDGAALICLFLSLHVVCGWFIIQRKRWAWVVGTFGHLIF